MLYDCSAEELGVYQVVASPNVIAQDDRRSGTLGLIEAMLAPIGHEQQSDWEELTQAMRSPRRIAPKALGIVSAAITNCRRLDDLVGSHASLLPALAQRDLLTKLLQAEQAQEVRQGLLTATSEVAQLLGWLAFDMAEYSVARTQFHNALRAAHEASDETLAAYILGYLSILATYTGEPYEGVAFAQAARSRAKPAATARTLSWLSTVEAEAMAVIGDAHSMEHALEQAEAELDEAGCDQDPTWMYHYGRAGLKGSAGTCYLTLNLPEASRKAITETIHLSAASEIREQALYLTALASTYVAQGEPGEACDCARRALVVAEETTSNRAIARIRQLRRHLEPWSELPCVKNLDEELLGASD